MSDEDTTVVDDEGTLYEQIVDTTGIEYDAEKYDSIEDYKRHLVDWYADETEEGEATIGDKRYEESPEAVCAWVDAATKVAKANRQGRRKKALPVIDGLEEEDDEPAEEKPKRARRTRAARAEKKVKEAPPERDPTNNRYGHTARLLFKDPDMSFDDVMAKLNRDGHDYAEITVKRAFDAFAIFHKVATELGLLK